MPTTKVVDEQKLLHMGVLIGWGCLIYSHRKQEPRHDDPLETPHEHKMFLDCLRELFFATGMAREFRYIEELFLNYDCQPKLRNQVAELLEELKMLYAGSNLSNWYDYFQNHGLEFYAFNSMSILEMGEELLRAFSMLESFEIALGLPNNLSTIFFEYAANDHDGRLRNYAKFWRPLFVFLSDGYQFSPQELRYELDKRKKLTLDLCALYPTRPISYKELQEDIETIKTLDVLQINNFGFTKQHDTVFLELKILLQHVTSIRLVTIGLSGSSRFVFGQIKDDIAYCRKSGMTDNKFEDSIKRNLAQVHFLVELCMLQALIQSMPNVHGNNISQDYWQTLLEPYDAASKKNWLQDLNRKLNQYGQVFKIEDSIWKVIRDQIIHGHTRSLTNDERLSYEVIKREALQATPKYMPLRTALANKGNSLVLEDTPKSKTKKKKAKQTMAHIS